MSICKDEVIDDYVAAIARGADLDERLFAVRQIANIVLTMDDPEAIIRALKALNSLLPLNPGTENALDKQILTLIDRGAVVQNPELAEAIALFVYRRTQVRTSVAQPYIPALLSFLAYNIETTGAYSYYTLMIVVSEAPHYFRPHAERLVWMLDSPAYATKVFAMRVIAGLASTHPEYVVGARDALQNMAETSPQGLVKAEAAKAYRAVRDIPGTPRGYGSHLLDEPASASIYEKPVWQRAVECHLSTAYGSDLLSVDRPQRRRPGTKKEIRPSKRSNLYNEFVEDLKQIECVQLLEDQIAMPSPEAMAQAVPCAIEPVEATTPSTPRVAEISLTVMNEPDVFAPPPIDDLSDSTGALFLQEMMNEVQNDFSAKAGSILDAMGMGHLNRGSTLKAEDSDIKTEDGNHKISAREFVLAMEKLFKA